MRTRVSRGRVLAVNQPVRHVRMCKGCLDAASMSKKAPNTQPFPLHPEICSWTKQEVSNAVKSEAISPLKINVIEGMYTGTEEMPIQLRFHHCHLLPCMDKDEPRGKDRKLEEWLGDLFWKPPSPPADDLDDPAPLISASYLLSLGVFLEGFTKHWSDLSAQKYLNIPVSIYLLLTSCKNIVKHEPSSESCFPFCQTGRYWALIVSCAYGLEPSPFFFAQRTHKSIWDCARAIAALNKQQQGPSMQFSGLPVPFVRWYQLWYFKERCQKCKNEQLRINLLVGMGICLPPSWLCCKLVVDLIPVV